MTEDPNWWQKNLEFRRTHGFAVLEGDLYKIDPCLSNWKLVRPARAFSWHYYRIQTGRELRACLRAGACSWPGGYDVLFYTHEGDWICPTCVLANFKEMVDDLRTRYPNRIYGLASMADYDPDRAIVCERCGKGPWEEEELPPIENE